MPKMPTRLLIVGGAFLCLGLMGIPAAFLPRGGLVDLGRGPMITDIGVSVVLLSSGWGLLLRHRWAWALALVISVAMLGVGLLVLAGPGDIAFPGAAVVTFYVLVLPGAGLLAALVTPATIRWLRRRPTSRSSATPTRPDN